MPLPAGTRLAPYKILAPTWAGGRAHYQITAKLGEGRMGEIYRAAGTKLGATGHVIYGGWQVMIPAAIFVARL